MILWKGIDFKSKGIIVETTPKISKGKKRIETYEIEGRNGFLTIDKGTYASFVVSVECHINEDITSIDNIKEFLDGYGTLSFDGKKEYTAIIQNAISFEKVTNFKKFVIQFLVNPISKDIEAQTQTINTSPFSFEINEATTNMYPLIKIEGTGDVSITFNNKTFYLYGLDSSLSYILDCENKEIINSNGLNCSGQMRYDFPYLKSGNNDISYTGIITNIEIEYKKAYL